MVMAMWYVPKVVTNKIALNQKEATYLKVTSHSQDVLQVVFNCISYNNVYILIGTGILKYVHHTIES